jgi:preprotein translocase subunit SecE
MKELWSFIIFAVIALVVFTYFLRRGSFLRISQYFRETQEELKKCTWPTWEELKGATVVVMIATLLVGFFTMGVDALVTLFIRHIV